MTTRDSFLFGLILVGFCGALAVADEPETYDGCKSLRDKGLYCLEIQVPPGGMTIDCLSSDPKACPPTIPDNRITPGVVANDGRDAETVCGMVNGLSYSKRHRATPETLKRQIRNRDGCDPHNSEVDHRLPLALGGADVEANLWCQPAPAFHEKDRLEVWAWEGVCKHHAISLPEAQHMFLAPSDWRAGSVSV